MLIFKKNFFPWISKTNVIQHIPLCPWVLNLWRREKNQPAFKKPKISWKTLKCKKMLFYASKSFLLLVEAKQHVKQRIPLWSCLKAIDGAFQFEILERRGKKKTPKILKNSENQTNALLWFLLFFTAPGGKTDLKQRIPQCSCLNAIDGASQFEILEGKKKGRKKTSKNLEKLWKSNICFIWIFTVFHCSRW